MATLDEIFASMPDEAAAGVHDLLVVDPESRTIDVPQTESIFGVENDGRAETKYFKSPRYVGNGIDLASCFLRVNFQNANGDRDGHLVEDLTVSGDYVHFSWELSKKVTQYKGVVQFIICANLPGSTKVADWHTTLAQGTVLEGLEPDAAVVEAASSDLIAQLLQTVTKQIAAVEAEGAAQIDAVQEAAAAATAEAKAAVEAKGAATLATIPEDYTALDNQVDKLTRNTAGAIVCAAEGETIQVHDSSDHHLQGLRIFGRSTQDGTPTPEAPVEIVSTPAPVLTVCGTNLWNHKNDIVDMTALAGWGYAIWRTEAVVRVLKPKTKYTMRFAVSCLSVPEYSSVFSDDCGFALYSDKENGRYVTMAMTSGGGAFSVGEKRTVTCTFVTPENVQDPSMGYEILRYTQRYKQADGTAVYATVKFEDVQLELGDTATEYEPYTGAAVAVSKGLPGIPVESGGNYTDANGQQWICDEVDLGRGVYVRRVLEVTYDGAGETWYKSKDDSENYLYHISIKQDKSVAVGDCFCNRLQRKNTAEIQIPGKTLDVVGISPSPKYNVIYLNVGYYISENTVEALTAYLAANPVTVQYALATPIETALSDEEILAFKALRSNKPTTTILNDAGAHMAMEYVADTKLYIDQKLAEILAANHT